MCVLNCMHLCLACSDSSFFFIVFGFAFQFDALNNTTASVITVFIYFIHIMLLKREHKVKKRRRPTKRCENSTNRTVGFEYHLNIFKRKLYTRRRFKHEAWITKCKDEIVIQVHIQTCIFSCSFSCSIFRPPFVHYAVCTGLNKEYFFFAFEKQQGFPKREIYNAIHASNAMSSKCKFPSNYHSFSTYLSSQLSFHPKHTFIYLMRQFIVFLLCDTKSLFYNFHLFSCF